MNGETPRFIYGSAYSAAVSDLLSQAADQASVECAVAFVGKGANVYFGVHDGQRLESVRLICDLMSGACNPDAIKDLMDRGAKIKTFDGLHAKVYIGGGQAIVGSANLSANGLGANAESVIGNEEAGIRVTDRDEVSSIAAWFNELWDFSASSITAVEISKARKLWDKRARALRGAGPLANGSLLSEALRTPEKFGSVYVVPTWLDRSAEADRLVTKLKKKQDFVDREWDGYEDWPDLPDDAWILDFACTDKTCRRSEFNGTWRSPPKPRLQHLDNGCILKLVHGSFDDRTVIVDGRRYKLTKREERAIKQSLTAIAALYGQREPEFGLVSAPLPEICSNANIASLLKKAIS